MPQWVMLAALAQFGGALVVTAGVPGPRRPLTWAAGACALLFCLGASACVAACAMPFADVWEPAGPTLVCGLSAILLSMWLAQAPDRDDDADGGTGGGGGGPRPPERPPSPPGGPADLSPPRLDWAAFEHERARWEREHGPAPV